MVDLDIVEMSSISTFMHLPYLSTSLRRLSPEVANRGSRICESLAYVSNFLETLHAYIHPLQHFCTTRVPEIENVALPHNLRHMSVTAEYCGQGDGESKEVCATTYTARVCC